MWNKRTDELELIDLGYPRYTKEEYLHCLEQLGRIGYWLGSQKIILDRLKKLNLSNTSVVDIGCGGGDLAFLIAQKYPNSQVRGIDLNPDAIEYAKMNNPRINNLSFDRVEEKDLKSTVGNCDILTCTLVCHHMNDQELVEFLKQAKTTAKSTIILHDLHRHPIAYYFFKAISPILFPNRLIEHDGALSIKRAFTRNEWKNYLSKANIPPSQYRIRWKWPFQWLVEIEGSDD